MKVQCPYCGRFCEVRYDRELGQTYRLCGRCEFAVYLPPSDSKYSRYIPEMKIKLIQSSASTVREE